MAPAEDKVKKSKDKAEKAAKGEKADRDKKEKKDKGDKKDKSEKKDKAEKKDKGDKKDKKSASDKLAEHKVSADGKPSSKSKGTANGAAPAKPAPPARPAPRRPPKPEPQGDPNDYLAGLDLPSSESESDEEVERRRGGEEETVQIRVATGKEVRKIADRDRKAAEKAAAAKAAALRDDDNVFDVSYENQGADGATDSTLSATDIKVHNLTIRAKGKVLLENTTLTIAAGRRYGLVGPNGKGKSTLLRMIARRQIPVPETLDVLLVEQEIVGSEKSALEAVVAADVELMELRAEEAEINRKLGHLDLNADGAAGGAEQPAAAAEQAHGEDDGDLAHRLTEIYDRMAEINAASAESRASKILHGLGFTEAMQRRATQDFSGGWRMRISLARALYIQPTVLLLDEPTNHLDLRAVLWLEEYLTRWKKTLIVVSHDREFLNSVTTDIIHLHDERLHYYRGNFAQFEEMYEQRRREVNKEFEKYQKQLKAAKKSGSKAAADKVEKGAKQKAKQKAKAQGGGSEAAAAAEAPRQWNDYNVHFEFPEPTELPPPLLQLIDADFKYPGREDFGMKNMNIGIDMGSRVAIVGPNGAGKSTLMNLLAGDLTPTQGEQRRSHKLRVGRYAQHFVDALRMDETPVEYLLSRFPESGFKATEMRAMLGRFGLSGHHHLQPITKLSGGQKARVVFTSVALSNPHILLLDEPTNHLDMQSIDALADAIEEFDGGVVIISHDARLLSRVCDDEKSEVWIVEDGEVHPWDGDFEDYKDELVREIAAELDEQEAEEARRQAERDAKRQQQGKK